ncbi:carboxypeptidase-like regulatory domain-containing protein [Desulfotignum phosphitoxidans]|uniref:Lipoprotein n=1 Tax=Desulfotignum phosphitoxidans DSM 13687 TaxID=1286635 RepID=S0G3L6_9BACT|nr:carboxypeptidase-like regulatory domain-containing protein [Desulfotignum phosphitoxidans]EMS78406.1 hypothetical protein Dpo_8c00730 [Desulfotignum phosphitoxidans DSM 13687]
MKKNYLATLSIFILLALIAGCGKNSGLEGKIVDNKGNPMANVKILAKQTLPVKGYEKFEVVTDSDGVFKLEKLFPTSEYVLLPLFDDWSFSPQRILKYIPNKLTAHFSQDGWATEDKLKIMSGPVRENIVLQSPIIILPAIAKLEGKIVDNKGNPMANVKILAKQTLPVKGYEKFEVVTDSDGVFKLEKLFPTSEYVLLPLFDDWSSEPQRVLKYEPTNLTTHFNKDGWTTEDKLRISTGTEQQKILLGSPITILPVTPIPEFHGIYALDNGNLTELGEKIPEKDRRNFNEDLSIIISNNIIDKTQKNLEEIISINERSYIRCEVEQVYNRKGGERIQLNIHQLGKYKLNNSVEFRIKPVKNNPEMIIIVPKIPFEPGLYSLTFNEDSYFFGIRIGDVLESDTPLNNCVDLFYSSIDKDTLKKSFDWGTFASQTFDSKGRTTSGNLIVESSYKPCNILNKNVAFWKSESSKLIEDNQWVTAIKFLQYALAATPNDEKIINLLNESQKFYAEKLRIEEKQRQDEMKAKITKDRPIIISILSNGKSYFGKEITENSKIYPFRIHFTSYNSGHFEGEMDYYAKSDRAILKFEGQLIDNKITIKHTGTIRKGKSAPLFIYKLNLNNNQISGYYHKIGRSVKNNSKVVIDISEEGRIEQEKRYTLLENSITPSKTILIEEYYYQPFKGTVTLTDVNYKINYKLWGSIKEEEIFFYKINLIEKSKHLYGPSIEVTDKNNRKHEIKFRRENESGRDTFYDKLMDSFKVWKKEYSDIIDKL